MNFLKHIWPWSRFSDYEWRLKERAQRVDELKNELDFHRQEHSIALAKLQEEKDRHEVSKNGLRHIATTLAIRGNFDKIPLVLILLFVCFSGFAGTPILPTLLTTNPTPILSSISGPMVTTNGSGKPTLTYNGGGLTNVSGGTTTYYPTNSFFYTWNLYSTAFLPGDVAQGATFTANTVYVVAVYQNSDFWITNTSWYISVTDIGKHYSFGVYDLSGNRLWYDIIPVNGSGAYSNTSATVYHFRPGWYYVTHTTDSSSATVWGWSATTSEVIIKNSATGSIVPFSTAANASSAGVPPATLGVLTSDNSVGVSWPIVMFR